jgi:hypothetical protein
LLLAAAFCYTAGSPSVIVAAWQQNPSAVEEVLQAAVRLTGDAQCIPGTSDVDWQHVMHMVTCVMKAMNGIHTPPSPGAGPAAAAAAAAAAGPGASTRRSAAGSKQQQQQQQQPPPERQPSSSRTGLLLSCYKVFTKRLEQRSKQPVDVLVAFAHSAPLCPGLGTLADVSETKWPFKTDYSNSLRGVSGAAGSSADDAEIAAAGLDAALLASGLYQFLDRSMASLHHLQMPAQASQARSSSSSSREAATAAAAAAAREHGDSLLPLVGRALHVAASALLQLHEEAAAASRGADRQHAETQQQAGQDLKEARFKAHCFALAPYFYTAALGPLLKAAYSSSAASSRTTSSSGTTSSSSSSAAGAAHAVGGSTTSVQDTTELQQLQQQLLKVTWVRLAQAVNSLHGTDTAGLHPPAGLSVMQAVFMQVFPASAAQQMLQLATGVCTQLVSAEGAAQCCANPGCTNCTRLTERELVSGKSTVCSGCRAVRLCSAACNTAYWKAGHRQVCKRLRGGKQQQEAGERNSSRPSVGSAAGTGGRSSTKSKKSSSSSSSSSSSVGGGQGSSNGGSDTGARQELRS